MWNANWRVNEKLSDRENWFLPCRAIFIIKMRIIILLYISFSAGLCNLQLIQSNRKIKDIFWIKTKALSRLPAVKVYYTLCSSEEAKKCLSRELRVAFPTYFLGEGNRYKPISPWTLSKWPLGEHWGSLSVHCQPNRAEVAVSLAGAVLSVLSHVRYVQETLMLGKEQGVLHCWVEVSHGRQGPTNSPALKQQLCTELSSSTSRVPTCTALRAYAAFKRKAIARDTFKKLPTNL